MFVNSKRMTRCDNDKDVCFNEKKNGWPTSYFLCPLTLHSRNSKHLKSPRLSHFTLPMRYCAWSTFLSPAQTPYFCLTLPHLSSLSPVYYFL